MTGKMSKTAALSIGILIFSSLVCLHAFAQNRKNWDLGNSSQLGQITIISDKNDGGERGVQVAAGDVNGDGYTDVVVTGHRVFYDGRNSCGAAYVFYGPKISLYVHFYTFQLLTLKYTDLI